jgi:2-dehydro-3-deoxyphosphooctonate aldolase (KDO 8-P synthase)
MKPILIAGPCQHQSLEHSMMIGEHCAKIASKYGFDYVFKASYDKANRSSDGTMRGQGLENTMEDFLQMKEFVPGLQILTDVHTEIQIRQIQWAYPDAVDILQIPAFLCRQTDLVKAACRTGKIVNIKKGQFLAPWDMKGILSKTKDAKEVWITERGTSFGYNALVVDFTGLQYMLDNYSNHRIILDATHSVQKPGGNGQTSGGNRDYVPRLAAAAAATGIRSFFLEVHDDPDNAPSDGPNSLRLEDLEKTVKRLAQIMEIVNGSN